MSGPSLPLVAVLTTLYKGDAISFADIALRSIQDQTYPPKRIRVYLYVDGPVGTEHVALVERWKPLLHRVTWGEVNQGLTHGLNTLLGSLENEDYLLRMDLDDVSMPERIAQQVKFMEANPKIDLLGCNSTEINESGSILYERSYPETHESIVGRLARCNPMLHPTYCIRGSTWRRDSVAYRSLYLNEDLGFLFDVTQRGWRLHNLQERLFQWRTGKSFFGRRKFRRSVVELETYLAGVWSIWGLSPRLLWPFARFSSRLMPAPVARFMYRSTLRNRLLG
jgi:hypothetical protein